MYRDYQSVQADEACAFRSLWRAHKAERTQLKTILLEREREIREKWGPLIERATERADLKKARFQ